MVEIPIDFVPRYEQVAVQVLEMVQRNVTSSVIQATLGIDALQYRDALRFARTGERPPKKPTGSQRRNPENIGKAKTNWPKSNGFEVARMRDDEGLSFAEIGRRLGKPNSMIYKAYDFAHPEIVADAVKHGHAIRRDAKKARLRPDELARLEGLLLAGKPTGVVAKLISCSLATVIRRRARLAKYDLAVHSRVVNEALANDKEFSELLAKASEIEAAMNQPGLTSRRLSQDEIATAKRSILDGDSVKVTAQLVGCSTKTIVDMRKRMRTDRAA